MPSSSATVTTDRAPRYIKQLLSHLGHRANTELADDGTGTVTLSNGHCTMTPTEHSLRLAATADDEEALARVQDVVGRHLIRFANQEVVEITWERG
jgi:caffeoyl-CoA O-methyltransferase